MSSKWNNAQKLQKTPKVCKAGPETLPPELRQFRYYPLQAHADWKQSITPLEAAITGIALLIPNPALLSHSGRILGTRTRLDLHLQYFPDTESFIYTISLFINDVFDNAVFVEFSQPAAALPFAAGLFTWDETAEQLLVHSKIYS